jgi:hypothetical protein
MTEEVAVVEEVVVEETEMSSEEQTAFDKGWRPEEQFEGDGWIPAKEYLGRAPLYEGLSKANKKIKRMEQAMDRFSEHNKKIEEATYAKAKAEIKQQRIDALKNEDYDTAIALEDKARELEAEPTHQNDAPNDAFEEWQERNSWYNDNRRMTLFADAAGQEVLNSGSNVGPEELYRKVEAEVRKEFPEEFSKALPNRGAPPSKGGGGKVSGSKYGLLSAEQKKLCNEFVAIIPGFTQEDYIKQLEASGQLAKRV